MVARLPGSLLAIFLCLHAGLRAQDEVLGHVAELLRSKDDADIGLIDRITASKDRRGAEGLVQAFDEMGSLRMRRAVLDGLVRFLEVPEAEQPAAQKLANIAASSGGGELMQAAIDGLGKAPKLGKHFLRRIVDSDAPDFVREPALREHVRHAGAEDADFYKHLWNLKQEQRKDAEGKIEPPELHSIRLLAFEGVVPQLGDDALVETLRREVEPRIRRRALEALHKRGSPKTTEMADWVLSRTDFPGPDRAAAARILIDRTGAKAVDTFVDLAKKRDVTQEDLRQEMARLIADLRDDAVDKRMQKLVGRGKPHEKVFALQATMRIQDAKFTAQVRKGLADPEPEVRRAAASALAARRDRESLPQLRALLEKSKVPGDRRLAIEAIGEIEGMTTIWLRELAKLSAHEDADVRNAAIDQLGRARARDQMPQLLAALEHEDWSTRLAAIEAVAGMRTEQAVPKFIERLAIESGRLRRRLADALWNLTAQPFDEDVAKWQQWWRDQGEKFAVVTEKQLDAAEKERELRRRSERTSAAPPPKFFGIEVASHRVVFVLDVSGSMLESMYGRYVGKRGAARIDVAKMELMQAIERLDEGTLFNVFAFSTGVARWQKEGIGTNTAQSRKDALVWVERLGASGATNLYDTMKEVFADPDVDTVFVLSDGEPTNGAVIDPHRIRQDVALWNKHRKVKIHTVAVGSSLEILQWLAQDSGGTYLQMR